MTGGIFGNMFDFNRDGELSAFERAAEFQFFHDVILAEDESEEYEEETVYE